MCARTMRVGHNARSNLIRTVERSLLTNSVNPPTVSFIHNVIRDGNYSGLYVGKIIYSLREKSITAREGISLLARFFRAITQTDMIY